MTRKRLWITVGVVIALAALLYGLLAIFNWTGGGGVAHAAAPTQEELNTPAYTQRITAEDTGVFAPDGPISESRTTERCRSVTEGSARYNNFGDRLFVWWQSVRWCWRGDRLTSAKFNHWPQVGEQLWNVWGCSACPAAVVSGGSFDAGYKYRRSHGEFRSCLLWVCKSDNRWVAMTVRPRGSITATVDQG